MHNLSCFKAYDIRGIVPTELNTDIAYDIGRAYATFLKPDLVVVGHDIRLTGPEITEAVAKGLMDMGADVVHIGECGSEEVYFAVPYLNADGGICVTASHNPANYSGMKFVRAQSLPISSDNGLLEIRALAEQGRFTHASKAGQQIRRNIRPQYAEKLLSLTDLEVLKPLRIVTNPGNGGAGAIIDALEPHVPYWFEKIMHVPDGHFPNGVPNPLLPQNREATKEAVLRTGADMGVAWDGDFDRCFLFDENGAFIEGYYIVGLLAQSMLEKYPGEVIVHDPRLYWATQRVVGENGGKAVVSKTGHAFIKETMRDHNAVYGGEMSAHHYFRDFHYCDNGNIPWLLIADLMSRTGKKLSELVADLVEAYPCSGEINLKVTDSAGVLRAVKEEYEAGAVIVDHIDGLSIEYESWRFNVRASNTEPLLRINVEAKSDLALVKKKTEELLGFIHGVGHSAGSD